MLVGIRARITLNFLMEPMKVDILKEIPAMARLYKYEEDSIVGK